MKAKAIIGSSMALGLLALGIFMGSTLGANRVSAQTGVPARTNAVIQSGVSAPAKVAVQPNKVASRSGVLAQIAAATAVATPQPAAPTITKAQAEQAALAANPGNTIDHTSLSNQNSISIYDVDFANGGGVIINAETGAVISTEAAGADKGGGKGPGGRGGHFGRGADQAALAAKATVTKAQAEQAALAASPGNTVDHSRLGDDNGTVFWDVDFANGGGVTLDAQTGKVIATEAAGTDKGGHGRGPAQTKP